MPDSVVNKRNSSPTYPKGRDQHATFRESKRFSRIFLMFSSTATADARRKSGPCNATQKKKEVERAKRGSDGNIQVTREIAIQKVAFYLIPVIYVVLHMRKCVTGRRFHVLGISFS